MGNQRGLGLHFIFVTVYLFATSYTCLGIGNITVVCSKQERLALLKFKQSVRDDYEMLSSWVGNDCCRWERVYCDGVTGDVERLHLRGDMGSYIDLQDGHSFPAADYLAGEEDFNVVHVDYYYLVGTEVNSSLAELRHLKYLDLSGNDFRGSQIPEFLGSLKQLSYLNLSHAGFQGNIPHHIGNLSNLKVLDLSSNYQLMADDIAWTSGLSSLERLDLSSLDLSGTQNSDMVHYLIPSLKELRLSRCRLSDADLGPFLNSSKMLSDIEHLDLSFNYFKEPLPRFFQNMTSLAFLDLSCADQSLAWDFANLLIMIPSLSELHLSSCGLDNSFLSSPHFNLSTLSNIQHLDLSSNSIEGMFPSVLTDMTSLRVLDLSGNKLNSSVPVMPNLIELDLSSNRFQQIEHVGIWRQCLLKKLSVSNNYLDLKMTDSPKNASECSGYALERLDLHGTLNGTIPNSLGRLENLRYIDLSSNGLTGAIPISLGRIRSLEVLDLSYNKLIGPIPILVGELSRLDLSFNQLSGVIPESFGNLVALTYLNLGSNRLTGPIPTSLRNLVSLQEIWVFSNLLNGTLPVSIGQLSKLRSLGIFNNSLEGVVSEAHFANFLMLKHLDTSSNTKLTFNISHEWIPPFKLGTLDLSSCNIANGFPQWLRNQRKLKTVVLSNASVSGPLPEWFSKMPVIPYLDLSNNKLSGPLTNLPNEENVDMFGYIPGLFLEDNLFNDSIPNSLCKRTDLTYLDLSRNRLTGKIPKCIENLHNLFVMGFGSNLLSGVIPTLNSPSLRWLELNDNNFIEFPRELGSLSALEVLDLADNKFSGNVPEWIGDNSPSLSWLKLSGNCFSGELPREFGNLQNLKVLDLGDNEFSGNLSGWIEEGLTSLRVLRLHNNNFIGRIPQSLCKYSNLQILDVAYNNLTGSIPHCLGELNAMVNSSGSHPLIGGDSDIHVSQVMKGLDLKYTKTLELVFNMDLSSNNLVGDIPDRLTALSMLVGLNLSNNHLSGGIPGSIGDMTKLESLDFSKNNLIGMIPPSMAALNFLSHLNLSHNNLSGRIPIGNQLQTLTDPSIYAGNKNLCGTPLPKDCSNHEDPTTMPKKKYKAADEPLKVWFFYLDIVGGFATGFWGVIGVLLFKKQWRKKLFMFAEETMDKIYVVVMVRVAKMKRGRAAA